MVFKILSKHLIHLKIIGIQLNVEIEIFHFRWSIIHSCLKILTIYNGIENNAFYMKILNTG